MHVRRVDAHLESERPAGPTGRPGAQGVPGTIGGQGAQGPAGAAGAPLVGETTFSFGGTGSSASKAFVKLGDIKGESQDSNHKGDIEILSYSLGSGAQGSGAASGKTTFHDLSFTHKIDKASPNLFAATVGGTKIDQGTLALTHRKAGKGQQEYLIVKMTDIIVTKVTDGTSIKGGSPIEEVTLNFQKMQATFPATGNSGKKISPVTVNVNNTVKFR